MLPVIVAIMAALPISSAAMAVSMDSDVPLAITAVARASTGQPIVLVSSAGATPGTWLGVRMSPVPRPLAAHLDTPGVMVTNVVRESPADAAGLQQFDVITQLNGKAVAAPEDLVNAIKDLPVGQTVTLTLVRKAAAQQVRVTLGERPADRELAMKFDEPEDPVWNDAFSITGRKFLFSPDGQFQIKNLGPLDDLKDVIIDLQGMPPFGDPNEVERQIKVWVERHMSGDDADNADDADVRVRVQVQIDKDGQSTEIRTDADGKITVKRTAQDGTETVSSYANEEALAAGDPAAYELYTSHVLGQGRRVMIFRHQGPGPDGTWSTDVNEELHARLEKAMRKAEEAMEKAGIKANEAMEKAQQRAEEALRRAQDAVGKVRIEARSGSISESYAVNKADDGSIGVIVIRNGEKVAEYKFNSAAAFREAQPEIYAKVKDFVE
ncbi:MAG: PDZ domain-containing protein [Phycisphaerales bacterium]|nr:PDZ domain-containing protein [Phycisphaerales bacterium]